MARAVIVAVVIHDAKLFAPRGQVRSWVVGINREVKVAAREFAPPGRSMAQWPRMSTGNLRSSIYGRVTSRSLRIIDSEIGVDLEKAPYGLYVLDGTAFQGQRYIYSRLGWANKFRVDDIASRIGGKARTGKIRKGWAMGVPAGAGFASGPRLRVHGQRANPFLTDGYNLVTRHHRALKPFRQRFIYQ